MDNVSDFSTKSEIYSKLRQVMFINRLHLYDRPRKINQGVDMKIVLVLFLIPLVSVSCRHGGKKLTFIGQDGEEKSRIVNVSQADYEEKLNPVIEQIYSETMITLDQTTQQNPKWEIEKLEVGIGATGTLGIGQWKVGATPGFRLMFRPKK
jgi:ABC-type cobalt transport system substrate-binding protein